MRSTRGVAAAVGLATIVVGGCDLGSAPLVHPGPSRAVQIADINADGAPDVVAGGTGGELVLLNDGAGNLAGVPASTSADVRALAVGDVDGDGAADRVELDRPAAGPSTLVLSHGDGEGGFSDAAPIPDPRPDAEINDVALADLDADGYPDLLTAEERYGARVRFNDGAGTFTRQDSPTIPCGSMGSGYFDLTVDSLDAVDLDADGDLDVVWTGSCDYPEGDRWARGIGFNDGRGYFSELTMTTAASPGRRVGVSVADVNEDGHLDRILGNPDARVVEIELGRDPATPGPLPPNDVLVVPTPAPVAGGATADIDGDGHVDLVISAPRSGVATVLYGDGAGAFPDRHALVTGASTIDSLAAADLDGDGRTDLVLGIGNDEAGTGSPSVSVFRNTLDGRQH